MNNFSRIFVFFILFSICFCTEFDGLSYNHIEVDDISRWYYLYVPNHLQNLTQTEKVPLLFCLHGGGGSATGFRNSRKMHLVAQKFNFILVYPEAFCDGSHVGCNWNSMWGKRLFSGIDDVKFIDSLIGQFLHNDSFWEDLKIRVNESEIYVHGHSNGGMFTYSFSTNTTYQIKAIAPTSGTLYGISADATGNVPYYPPPVPNNKTSVVHFHGGVDVNVKMNGGITDAGNGRYDVSMNVSLAYWMDNDECTNFEEIVEVDRNNTFILTKYGKCGKYKIRSIVMPAVNHPMSDMDDEFSATLPRGGGFTSGMDSFNELVWLSLLEAGDGKDYSQNSDDDDDDAGSEGLWVYFAIGGGALLFVICLVVVLIVCLLACIVLSVFLFRRKDEYVEKEELL